jgi:hypothetical protein
VVRTHTRINKHNFGHRHRHSHSHCHSWCHDDSKSQCHHQRHSQCSRQAETATALQVAAAMLPSSDRGTSTIAGRGRLGAGGHRSEAALHTADAAGEAGGSAQGLLPAAAAAPAPAAGCSFRRGSTGLDTTADQSVVTSRLLAAAPAAAVAGDAAAGI